MPPRASYAEGGSPRDDEDLVVLPHALRDVDADVRARARILDGLVLELHPIHSLIEVGGVALEVQRVADPDPPGIDGDDSRIHVGVVVGHDPHSLGQAGCDATRGGARWWPPEAPA